MNFRIENLGMLLGLFALAVPILLHLLQRRRFDTLDWGAMQFLPDSTAMQRKRRLDEILLMLLRMAMIALVVLALATPTSTSAWLAPLGDRSAREIVIILDSSFSMDVRIPGQPTPWAEGVGWTREHVEQASGTDSFTFILARQSPVMLYQVEDVAAARPTGNPDMPRALKDAWNHLKRSNAANKEIIVVTDGQKHGLADPATLAALDNLGSQWRADMQTAKEEGIAVPSLRVVKVGADLPKTLPNYRLAPLTASRSVAKIGQKITFRSTLHLEGLTKITPPRSVTVEIDGVKVHDFALPRDAGLESSTPLSFQHVFKKAGKHVLSFKVDVDPAHDVLPPDNKQQLVEVVRDWPILLLDGDEKLSEASSSLFLERALAAERTLPHLEFTPAEVGAVKPAVIVLADVPQLTPTQLDTIDRHLAEGGGLFVLAGERVAGSQGFYTDQLYRNGEGWLPAKLSEVASAPDGAKPDPRKFEHPPLDPLRAWPEPSLREVGFKKWWKATLGPEDRGTVIGRLDSGDPFLIEKPYKKGRVILCTAPPDRRWDSTLPRVGEFLILTYELCSYLAGNRDLAAQANAEGPLDPLESNLARCTEDDWAKIRARLPITVQTEPAAAPSIASTEPHREEVWWLLLIAVVGLLCSEVWMTRRMALARGR